MRVDAPTALLALACALSGAGCGQGRTERDVIADRGSAGSGSIAHDLAPPVPNGPQDETAAAPAFPEGTRSLELVRTVGVRLLAGDDAKRIGTIAIDTRVSWTQTASGKGCTKPWVQIRPRGWICADFVKPTTKPPFGREVPILDRGELVPGVYGKITAASSVTYVVEKAKPVAKPPKGKGKPPKGPGGPVTTIAQADGASVLPDLKLVEGKPIVGSVNVRQYGLVSVAGKSYWKISQKDQEYVLAKSISPHQPSSFGGSRLGDDTGWALPIAFVFPRVASWGSATVTAKPMGGTVRQIAARTAVPLLEPFTRPDGKIGAYRIGEGEWLPAADVRVFEALPPPALLGAHERWIDVDLDHQILVAFEGPVPVYATLISSGTKEHPTETGVYRMWVKESEADMNGLNGEDPYSVATVPWTQFYSPERGLALHTAYWHDKFGTQKSRGCLNMAPRDARWLYFWSDPQVPPGWSMAAGVVEAPGSLVRVRSKADPDPPARGYAKKVLEVRQQSAPVK